MLAPFIPIAGALFSRETSGKVTVPPIGAIEGVLLEANKSDPQARQLRIGTGYAWR